MAATHQKAIAVAVKKGRYSQLALKWAVDNLASETQSLSLLHVRRRSDTFNRGLMMANYEEIASACGEAIAQGLDQSYKDNLTMQAKDNFRPLALYCKKKNVPFDEVLVDDDDIVKAIAEFVLTNNIDVLVVGSGSKGGILRRLKGPDTANKILKSVPYFCTVCTVSKGGAVSIKSASTAAQTLTSSNSVQIREPEIGIHVQPLITQMEPRLSAVSASESMFQLGPVKEFQFRSPLNNYGDSDFSWEGHAPADSDISFISSDIQFNDRLSSGFSNNSSNWSLGSFDSWQTSSSCNMSARSSNRSSNASNSSQYTMDEMRRLQLELMQTKKMYDAACEEVLHAKILASEQDPKNFEEDKMGMVQGSAVTLAKLENNKHKASTKITSIAKRIAEQQALQTC